ncbi:MAG: ferritin family protein [Desulfovermiculus sp.]|nr:ferritin family protein [Desulfovermiculus sp.]
MTRREDLIKIYEFALGQEYTGRDFFSSSINRMGVGAAVSAFKRLIAEEDKHIEFINRMLENLRSGNELDIPSTVDIEPEIQNYFDARAKSEFLQKALYESMIPDVTVFNTAWLIEKDLSEYYSKMAALTDGQASKALSMLAGWEKKHEEFFREYRDALSDTYSKMPWGG